MNAGLMAASMGGLVPFMLSSSYNTGMGCLVGVSGLSTIMVSEACSAGSKCNRDIYVRNRNELGEG